MKEHTAKAFLDGFAFLEAPRWHQGELWVSDIFGLKVYRISVDKKVEVVCDVAQRPAGLAFLPNGDPIVVSMQDRKLLRIRENRITVYADLSALAPADLNDIVADDEGRLYVGNFGYDHFGGAPKVLTDMIMVEPDGTARAVAHGLDFPNGAVLTDGGETLVVAESWSNRLTSFHRASNGELSQRRVYADMGSGQPDGICVDREGGIWVSCFNTGEVLRVLDGGQVTDRIKLGAKRAVACQLGGTDGRTLFCCSYAGSPADLAAGRAAAAIETVYVDIPAMGF